MSIVSTEWLSKYKSEVKIIDCSWHMPNSKRDPYKEYLLEHIENAIFFDLDKNSDQDTNLPHMLPCKKSWEKIISITGISNNDKIVIYDNSDVISSCRGWYNFIYGDRTAAYGLIMKDNPEMTKEKLDKEMAQFEKLGIIDVGDALTKGIGAMDMIRVQSFHKLSIDSGIIEEGSVDINKVATDQFVNKGHGLDIKAKLN